MKSNKGNGYEDTQVINKRGRDNKESFIRMITDKYPVMIIVIESIILI